MRRGGEREESEAELLCATVTGEFLLITIYPSSTTTTTTQAARTRKGREWQGTQGSVCTRGERCGRVRLPAWSQLA